MVRRYSVKRKMDGKSTRKNNMPFDAPADVSAETEVLVLDLVE